MDVRMPDGTIIRNVPEGTTKAAIEAKWRASQGDNSAARGFGLGVMKPVDNLARAVSSIPVIGPALDRASNALGMPTAGQAYQQNQAARANNTRTGFQLAGNIAGTLPTAALPGGAIAQGAAGGALLSDADTMGAVGRDAAIGAVASKVGEVAIRGVGRVVAGKIDPAAQRLAQDGVRLTPGRLAGKMASRIEDRMGSVPVVGDMARARAGDAIGDFNKVVADDALKPLGLRMPKSVQPGRETVDFVNTKLSEAYRALTPKLEAKLDNQFVKRVNVLRQRAQLTVEGDALFQRELERTMKGAFDPSTGIAKGNKLKGIDEQLSKLSATYSRADDPAMREVGVLLGDMREQVLSMVARTTPSAGRELQRINKAYGMFKRLQNASARATGDDGVFTPAQFQAAVKALDRSKDKAAFARGKAPMQQRASDAVAVLPPKVPDSGTAERVMQAGLAGGGVSGLMMGMSPQVLLPVGVGALAYTQAGGNALRAAMLRRPAGAQQAAARVNALAPVAARAAPALTVPKR